MAKTFTAPFAQDQRNGWAVVKTTVGMTSDGGVLLLTAGPEGALVTSISVMPLGNLSPETSGGGSPLLFLKKQGAADKIVIERINFRSSYTLSPTDPIPKIYFELPTEQSPLRLEAGDEIYAGNVPASGSLPHGIAFFAQYSNY